MEVHVHLKNAFPGGIGNRRITFGYNLWFASHRDPSTYVNCFKFSQLLKNLLVYLIWLVNAKMTVRPCEKYIAHLDPKCVNEGVNVDSQGCSDLFCNLDLDLRRNSYASKSVKIVVQKSIHSFHEFGHTIIYLLNVHIDHKK